MNRPLPAVKILQRFIKFKGGYDEITPPWEIPSGTAKKAQNVFQDINGGWEIFQGYESFDGRTAPSAAQYAVLNVTLSAAVAVGNTITQGGVSAVVIEVNDTYLIITKMVGTFAAGNISVGGVVKGTCAGAQTIDGGSTARLRAYYKNLAADAYRADIAAIPGSGEVLGAWHYNGKWYAFRNNAGGTSAVMHVESTSGWTAVSLGRELSFTSGGTTAIVAGNTITGAISGATAVVGKVFVTSGTWGAGTAAGRLILTSQTGTFQAENLDVGAALNLATIGGNSAAITLSPSGSYEFTNENFTGYSGSVKMYGVDGVNRGFEFDGTVFVPINTGMATDHPTHLAAFKNHLFYSFGGGSVQHSPIGDPTGVWTLVTGADEFGVSDEVTGFMVQPGTSTVGTMTVFTQNTIGHLYGTSASDWQFIQYKNEVGALANTVQRIGRTYFISAFGITELATSQDFGNFQDAVVSDKIKDFMSTKMSQVTASCIVRKRNQYWLFFADKSALCTTIVGGKVTAMMPMLFTHKVTCAASVETSAGTERIMVGCDDGKVRELYKGTSFDGDVIDWYAELAEDHFDSPLTDKRFRTGTLELSGDGYSEFFFTYTLGYNDPTKAQPAATQKIINLSPSYWDSFTWDQFYWDGLSLTPSRFRMLGINTNVSLILRGSGDFFSPLKFSGALVQFTPLRMTR